MNRTIRNTTLTILIMIIATMITKSNGGCTVEQTPAESYPVHRGIYATVFWAGEKGSVQNADIPNMQSCWDDQWVRHYGGIDDPVHRNEYYPAGFVPKENPFYVALPYNDFRGEHRKANAFALIPWANKKHWSINESMCKNQWLKITSEHRTVYAQWEDSGPFGSNDVDYVLGDARPHAAPNHHVGLDVSPAVRDYLHLTGLDKVDWQFVDDKDVPVGPWKQIVTTSQICWD